MMATEPWVTDLLAHLDTSATAIFTCPRHHMWGFPGGSDGKESACTVGDLGSLGWEDPLEEGMASHSSILAWRIPCTEKPGRLQSKKLLRVGHD